MQSQTNSANRKSGPMPRHLRAAKKPYIPPSLVILDASVARAKLKAQGDSKDLTIQKMMSICDERLNRRKPGGANS
jgi:hypothetical protein